MHKFRCEIIYTGSNGWDLSTARSLVFSSAKRAKTFCLYYTSKYDVLIRVYWDKWWCYSFCNGQLVWSDF